MAFDRPHDGWRGPVTKIDIAGDWGIPLGAIDSPQDILPWRLGVVLSADKAKAVVGLKPGKLQDGTIAPQREAVELTLDEVKWAKVLVKKTEPKAVNDILAPGDVIYVAPKDPANLGGAWSLMQIPDIGGGLIAMDPHTGRVLAVVGGFSFAMSQFDRAIQAKRQPGSVVQADRLCCGHRQRLQADLDHSRRADRDRAGPRTGYLEAGELRQGEVLRTHDPARRHREVAQPDDRAPCPGHGHADHHRVRQAVRRL